MKKFTVTVRRRTEQSGIVTVRADDADNAQDIVYGLLIDRSSRIHWDTNSRKPEFFVTDIEEKAL